MLSVEPLSSYLVRSSSFGKRNLRFLYERRVFREYITFKSKIKKKGVSMSWLEEKFFYYRKKSEPETKDGNCNLYTTIS